jgi:putative ABC transport system substrate-binding protein
LQHEVLRCRPGTPVFFDFAQPGSRISGAPLRFATRCTASGTRRIARRDLITLLGGAALALPLSARAQQPGGTRRIGVLFSYPQGDPQPLAWLATLREGLKSFGWTEGRNIGFEVRWAAPRDAELRQRFVNELVALKPDLILSHGTPATLAVLKQTRTIPVVFLNVSDPIGSGIVRNFPRPGANVTGFITMEPTLAGKWVELLKEIAPTVKRVAFLYNPATAPYAAYYLNSFKPAAASFAVEPITATVRDKSELESIIATQTSIPGGGLVVMPDTFTSAHRAEITALAARCRVRAVYPFRFFAEVGGLLSYGNDLIENFHRAAAYVDRILKGEKPGELPIQAPVKFELVINLKTAKALGLTLPPSLVARADRVIE